MSKLIATSIVLMSAGVVGLIFAIVMEIIFLEPIYYLFMKIAAGLFGVGGPLLGWGLVLRKKQEGVDKSN